MLRDYQPSDHFPLVSVLRATAIRFVSLSFMQDLCLDDPTSMLLEVPPLWLRLLAAACYHALSSVIASRCHGLSFPIP